MSIFLQDTAKVANIEKESKSEDPHVTECVAVFGNYQIFEPPKPQTPEIYHQIKHSSRFNNMDAVFPISKKLYDMIVGTEIPYKSSPSEIENYANILRKKQQLIFYGPPGTGKTYNAMRLAKYVVKNNSSKSLTI